MKNQVENRRETKNNNKKDNKKGTKKENRRVKVTKNMLKTSFIELLEHKEISRITIKEICEEADINRSTFYAHYTDQYDLMRKIQDELIENVEAHLSPYIYDEMPKVSEEMMVGIFEYIKRNAEICRLLLSERGDIHFQKRVLNLVYGKYMDDLTNNLKLNKEEANYVYAYSITGSIGVIQKWLNDDMKKSPEFMAKILLNMTGN